MVAQDPIFVNFLGMIDTCVTTGQAPDQLTAYSLNGKVQPDGSRPVCACPKHPKYKGTGDPRDATSFTFSESEMAVTSPLLRRAGIARLEVARDRALPVFEFAS